MTDKPDDNGHQLDDKAVELGRQILAHLQSGGAAIKKKAEGSAVVQDVKTKLDDFVGTGLTEAQMAETKPDEWKQHIKSPLAYKLGSKVKDAGAMIGMAVLIFPPAAIVSGAMVAAGSAVMSRERTKAEQELVAEKGAELNNPKGRFIRNAFKAFIGSNS